MKKTSTKLRLFWDVRLQRTGAPRCHVGESSRTEDHWRSSPQPSALPRLRCAACASPRIRSPASGGRQRFPRHPMGLQGHGALRTTWFTDTEAHFLFSPGRRGNLYVVYLTWSKFDLLSIFGLSISIHRRTMSHSSAGKLGI